MTLLVDVGNSRIKFCRLQSPQDVTVVWHNNDWRQAWDSCFASLEPAAEVFAACVAGTVAQQALSAWVDRHWHCKLVLAHSERDRDGLYNCYDTPATLGVDRWLAMLAAWHRSRRAFCLFDFGTALTVDMVNANGRHLGGWIVAGRAMQLRACDALAEVNVWQPLADWNDSAGTDSSAALHGGASLALLSAVRSVVASCLAEQGADMDFYCCGGDVPEPGLLPAARWCHEPDLVLQGLAHIAMEEQLP